MQFQALVSRISVVAIGLMMCSPAAGQALKPLTQKQPTHQKNRQAVAKKKQPYKLSSRFHLQQGANKGYLIVQVEMPKESHVYSLTQAGNIGPTKIDVADSKQFRLLKGFTPERPATVVEKDPVMQQRVEKHKGTIQFFAPIELSPGVDARQLSADVSFTGQVCSDSGTCIPIRSAKISSKFGGYFQRTASQSSAAKQARGNASKTR